MKPRFSPAPAGNGNTRYLPHHLQTVQPRACGERFLGYWPIYRYTGSAPRLRGTAANIALDLSQDRFSPAPAGNGMHYQHYQQSLPVQPRACGERTGGRNHGSLRTGSAPRLRGTAGADEGRRSWGRFSPAPAGNGHTFNLGLVGITVQPRACGERAKQTRRDPCECGSAPRLRGTAQIGPLGHVAVRFSPAPAGNGS